MGQIDEFKDSCGQVGVRKMGWTLNILKIGHKTSNVADSPRTTRGQLFCPQNDENESKSDETMVKEEMSGGSRNRRIFA